MIKYMEGDLFDSECQTLVNATNCEGVMGGGIAKLFKQNYPAMYQEYKWWCVNGMHTPMRPRLWPSHPSERFRSLVLGDDPDHWVLNLATKDKVKEDSTLGCIGAGLGWVVENYIEEEITSLATPALGCGLGGCSWNDVHPIMTAYLGQLDIPVEIYLPHDDKTTGHRELAAVA